MHLRDVVGTRDVGICGVGTRDVGTCDAGTRDVGVREVGNCDVVTCEVGTGRWVDRAIGWTRGITGLLVEVDLAIRSAKFVSFDHVLESANRRI